MLKPEVMRFLFLYGKLLSSDDQIHCSILNSNCFLLAVKLSAPVSADKLESKRQETKGTMEGMEGRWQNTGVFQLYVLCPS